MGMKLDNRRGGSVMAEINVTPMVDVMLVLLIIFMVVTPAIVAGFQAQLPQGEHLLDRPEKEERVVLGIDAAGRYYLNQTPVPREQLVERLTAEFAARPEDRVLFLKADRALKYREVQEAIELGQRAGARVVAAITEQRPGIGKAEGGR